MNFKQLLSDFNAAAFWAGISTFIFMVFGALTLQISIVERFELPRDVAQSWIAVTWMTSGFASLLFSLRFRQPIGIGWTIPGLVYLGSLAGRFSFEEIVTANLVAGIAIVLLGLAGAGRHMARLVPMPILMSVFAASTIDFVSDMMAASRVNVGLGVPMIGAYLLGRKLNWRQLPPVGMSVIVGAIAVFVLGQNRSAPLELSTPALAMPGFALSLNSVLTISLPMVVLVMSLGNGQGIGGLVAQGYRVRADAITIAVGLMTMVNAALGGHPASMTRTASAMLGGPSAGPFENRYWAAIIAFLLVLATSVSSGLLVSLVAILPPEYVLIVVGLAILSAFEDAMTRAFDGHLRAGAVVAFVVTLTGSLTVAGIPAAFWALVAGVAVSLVLETEEIKAHWVASLEPAHKAGVDASASRVLLRPGSQAA